MTLYKKLFAVFAIACTIPFTGCNKRHFQQRTINVVFRLDDYSAKSSTDMDLKIIDAFRKNEATVTIAVVPFQCDGDVHDPSPQEVVPLGSMKENILKTGFKDGIVDIALHGYSHQTINAEHKTEFSGLAYNSQVERLVKGKRLLESIIEAPVTTFVPPFNSYDLNTLRALEELGFTTLSAYRTGVAAENSKLNFLPYSCHLTELRDAVRTARTSSDTQPIIVVLIHGYDFQEIDKKRYTVNFREFCDLLSWVRSQGDVRILSIGQATEVINDLSARRFLATKRSYLLERRLLPLSLWEREYVAQYPERSSLLRTFLKVGGFYSMIVILGIVVFFMIGRLVFNRFPFIMRIGLLGSIVLSAIVLAYTFHDLDVGPRGMTISACMVAASIGLWISFRYVKRIERLGDRSN